MFVPKPSQSLSCRSAPRASIGPVPSCLLAPIGRHRLVARSRSQPTSSPQIRAGRHARKARPRSDVDPASHMRPRPARANERPGRPRAPPRRPRRRSAPSALLPPGDAAAGGGSPHSGLVAGASRQRRPRGSHPTCTAPPIPCVTATAFPGPAHAPSGAQRDAPPRRPGPGPVRGCGAGIPVLVRAAAFAGVGAH